MNLWRAAQPLVLASQSAARRAMLAASGIAIEVHPASLDERIIAGGAEAASASAIAGLLAREKVLAVSATLPDRLVVGADQVLALGARRFSKPADRAEARTQLQSLRGRTHELHSAVAAARGGAVMFEHGDVARLTMRNFSDDFLDRYLDAAGPAPLASVGGYQLEHEGVQLFERIDGDYFTILGLPLVPLLDFLRRDGALVS